ncbi:MAG TPA: hypothetical protein VL154_17805, partial [Acetobacteraceae bacterium]|nr:hypothetical protein [Acetobacteraceae bacterium]
MADLIEPLALLQGATAAEAIAAGQALPLAGGPAAFALAAVAPCSSASGSIRSATPGRISLAAAPGQGRR